MTTPWQPEIALSPERAFELVVEQFPELRDAPARMLGQGWDNTAVLIGDVVFRFPRRAIAAQLLETEARALPALAPLLPLSVPLPRWVGHAAGDYPWPFLGYRRLTGVSLAEHPLAPAELRLAATGLGEFLRHLHALDGAALGLPTDPIQRLELTARLPLLEERLARLERAGVIDSAERWRSLFEPPLPRPAARHSALHGDLYARHILADEAGQLCAVIDWGDVHAGDPAADLAVLWTLFPPTLRPVFLDAYGPVPPEALALARLRAVFHAAGVASYALAEHDDALLRAAREALAHALVT